MKTALASLFIIITFTSVVFAADQKPQRALFVSVIEKENVLASRGAINRLIDYSVKANIKTLFIQVYRANMAWFSSNVADQKPYEQCLSLVGEDPFALLIRKAHAKGIQVHAWVNLLSLSKNIKAPILNKYGPEILTRNLYPKKTLTDYAIDQQYFLEPGDLRVRKELETMVTELLTAYPDLDGIQFDYIRYPDAFPDYGYTEMNMSRFKKSTGNKSIDGKSKAWLDWKRTQVTELLAKLVRKARSIRPKIHVSTTGCMSYSRAYFEAFQDWPSWINNGLVEFVTVMSYPDNMPDFEKNIVDAQKRVSDLTKLKLGVGAYKFLKTPDLFFQQFERCEASDVSACVVFYYGNLVESPAMGKYLTSRYK